LPFNDLSGAAHEVQVDKDVLATLLVPPMVSGDSQMRFFPFAEFMDIPSADSNDSRNVVFAPTGYQVPSDLLTIGRFYQHPVLLDGYHRAAAFWKFGPADGSVMAYEPKSPSLGHLVRSIIAAAPDPSQRPWRART
jgi:hypothetical protein